MASRVAYRRAVQEIQAKVKSQPVVNRFRKLAREAPKRALKVMGRTAAKWQADALPHIPVRAARKRGQYRKEGRGQLKKSTQPFADAFRGTIRGGLIMFTHYAIWLIAGTRRIAKGAVMAWREGMPTVKSWPAKLLGGNPSGEMPIALPWRRKALEYFKDSAAKELLK